jgi:hypothetical protein
MLSVAMLNIASWCHFLKVSLPPKRLELRIHYNDDKHASLLLQSIDYHSKNTYNICLLGREIVVERFFQEIKNL